MSPGRLFSLAIAVGLFQSPLAAIFKRGPISMELVSEQKTVMDGKAFWIGWRIVREEGWHTYWKHPGDVGVAPRIKWSLPDGMRAGELLYSPPQRVKMGQVGAHGNYGETLFPCVNSNQSCLLTGAALSRYRGKRPGWPAPVNVSRVLPNCIIDIPVERQRSNTILFGNRGSSPFGKPFLATRLPIGVSGLFARAVTSISYLPPSLVGWRRGGAYFFAFGRQVRSHAPQVLRKSKSGWILSLKRSSWSSGKESELSGLLYRKEGWGVAGTRNYIRVRATLDEG